MARVSRSCTPTLALRHFGATLATNRVWQSLSDEERVRFRALSDVTAFYDPQTRTLRALPENYLGVATRIAAMSFELGLTTNRELVDAVIDRAAEQFKRGALFADDAPPTGRYDRYSNEYARYVYEAAGIAGRRDVQDAIAPSLAVQMRLWWSLVAEDGYGYPWGRSLGLVSYLDTPEIVGFLASHPEFRPAPLAQLAALDYQAWRWIRSDYRDDAHLMSLYGFGRGNYAYISIDREWQQTAGTFGKLAHSHRFTRDALAREGVTAFPATPTLAPVTAFTFFRRAGDATTTADGRDASRAGATFGVWVVRNGALRFALPFTAAPRAGLADYLPSPHGLAGFAPPVEQEVPALTPYLELTDGRTVVVAEGADAIDPAADAHGVRARWTRWSEVGARTGSTSDVPLRTEVAWTLEGDTLVRVETITATAPVTIARLRVASPARGRDLRTTIERAARTDTLTTEAGTLAWSLSCDTHPFDTTVSATGDARVGRGARGHIPLLVEASARNITLQSGQSLTFTMRLTARAR